MKVFIVMRNDKVDQVFFNADPTIARVAAETRARELNAKWAIAQVVEQEVIVPAPGPALADVSVKLAYEWVHTGHWNLNKFTRWLDAKRIEHTAPIVLANGKKAGRPNASLVYEWVRTKHWTRRQFTNWLNSFL